MYSHLDHTQIYYQKVGQGPDLVLLHGWGQDVSTWWGVAEELKGSFTLWMIDLPGFGRSELGSEAWSVGKYARVVADFIKTEKIDQPVVIGHSLGGRVAIKLAATQPELVGKIILEDSAGIHLANRSLKNGVLYVVAKILKTMVPNWFNLQEKLRQRGYAAIGSDYYQAGALAQSLQQVVAEDLTTELKQIDQPALIIWGEQDSTVPLAIGRRMYRLIPFAKLEIIDPAGHFPHLEQPRQFNYYVKDFANVE